MKNKMQIIHISDNNYNFSYPRLSDKPDVLIETIKKKHPDPNLFLINVNYKTETITRVENAGILFLKYLRLHHFNQHCVLYSFLTREEIMTQDPYNSIIFSGGITFVRMPDDLSKINFKLLATKRAPDDLSNFFKAEFRLPDNRHFFANWWGVLQLWKVQQAVEAIAGASIAKSIESGFTASIREMNSYDGLVARYIKGIHEKDIEKTLRILMAEKEEKYQNETSNRNRIQEEKQQLEEQVKDLDQQLVIIEELEAEKEEFFFTRLLEKLHILPNFLQAKIQKLNTEISGLENNVAIKQEYDNLLKLIKNNKQHIYDERIKNNRKIQSIIEDLSTSNSFITDQYNIKNIRDVLAEKKPSILFVDDQANDGWATIFQRAIYGQNCNEFSVIQPHQDESIENVVSSITNIITKRKIKLLMLDLRLKGESGNNYSMDEISGIQVLRKLSELPIACPALIISASNKIWSYRETLKLNADAYWIKEGLDDNINLEASIENYMRLVDMVYSLCFNEEYEYLYHTLLTTILDIKQSDSKFWWENKFWKDERMKVEETHVNKTLVEKKTIIETLSAGLEVFKMCLMERLQKNQTMNVSKYMASLVIIQFSRVLEIIHQVESNFMYIPLSVKMSMQLPSDIYWQYSTKLTPLRNAAAHQFSGSFREIKEFMDMLIEYLYLEEERFEDEELKRSLPMHNEWYTSEITFIPEGKQSVHLSNPNLALQDGREVIFLNKSHLNGLRDTDLKIGTKIKYQLIIIKGKTNYYANNPSIVEE